MAPLPALPAYLDLWMARLDPVGHPIAASLNKLQRGFLSRHVLVSRCRRPGALEILEGQEEVDAVWSHEVLSVKELLELLECTEKLEEVCVGDGDICEGVPCLRAAARQEVECRSASGKSFAVVESGHQSV